MGNTILKEYNVDESPFGAFSRNPINRASMQNKRVAHPKRTFQMIALVGFDLSGCGGYRGMWMLFNAVHKETKEAVCVHILHKDKIPKAQRDSEPFLELMRREANQLVRVRWFFGSAHFPSLSPSASYAQIWALYW